MSVLEYARKRLREAEYQASLGSLYAPSDIRYWTLYIEGAEAQQKEFQKELGFMISRIPPELKPRLPHALSVLQSLEISLTADLIPIQDQDHHRAIAISDTIRAINTAQEAIKFLLSKEEAMDIRDQEPTSDKESVSEVE